MKMHKLSVYMITFNEEKRLEKTLQAASRVADEIIIIDSGSRDKTGELPENTVQSFIITIGTAMPRKKIMHKVNVPTSGCFL